MNASSWDATGVRLQLQWRLWCSTRCARQLCCGCLTYVTHQLPAYCVVMYCFHTQSSRAKETQLYQNKQLYMTQMVGMHCRSVLQVRTASSLWGALIKTWRLGSSHSRSSRCVHSADLPMDPAQHAILLDVMLSFSVAAAAAAAWRVYQCIYWTSAAPASFACMRSCA
jgi:hypothetical protein